MAKKYMQDPEERERNNLIRQKLAAEQKKANEEAKRQLQEQKEQQEEEEEIEEEIDLTPAEPLFTTLLRKKGWYDIINVDGIVVDEDGLIPVGEVKGLRIRAAEAIAKRLNNEA